MHFLLQICDIPSDRLHEPLLSRWFAFNRPVLSYFFSVLIFASCWLCFRRCLLEVAPANTNIYEAKESQHSIASGHHWVALWHFISTVLLKSLCINKRMAPEDCIVLAWLSWCDLSWNVAGTFGQQAPKMWQFWLHSPSLSLELLAIPIEVSSCSFAHTINSALQFKMDWVTRDTQLR